MSGVSLGAAKPIRETDRALLVALEDADGEEAWIPKSAITDESECYSVKSGEGQLIVEEWWAKSHGYGEGV
jgi:hypothetical protein